MNTLPATGVMPAGTLARLFTRGAQLWSRLVLAVESRRFAYLLLLALQLKVIWGAWAVRDITHGDTSTNFYHAATWHANKQLHVAWAPLYCAFYGSLLHINNDPV